MNIDGIELQEMTYNGQKVVTWIHDGAEIFSSAPKSYSIIQDGTLLMPEMIVSNTRSGVSGHASFGGVASTCVAGKCFGVSCAGSGGHDSCSATSSGNFTLKLNPSLIGKTCTIVMYYQYSARYFTATSYINSGSTRLWTPSGASTTLAQTMTFTLTSDTITGHISFRCQNSSWVPAGYIGITSLTIEDPLPEVDSNELIPILSTYTGTNGKAIYSSELSTTYAVWQAFDNNHATLGGAATSANPYIGYQFSGLMSVYVNKVVVDLSYTHGAGTNYTLIFKLQYLGVKGTWEDIPNTSKSETFYGASTWTEKHYEWSFDTVKAKGIRLIEYSGNSWAMLIRTMQIYGEEA